MEVTVQNIWNYRCIMSMRYWKLCRVHIFWIIVGIEYMEGNMWERATSEHVLEQVVTPRRTLEGTELYSVQLIFLYLKWMCEWTLIFYLIFHVKPCGFSSWLNIRWESCNLSFLFPYGFTIGLCAFFSHFNRIPYLSKTSCCV